MIFCVFSYPCLCLVVIILVFCQLVYNRFLKKLNVFKFTMSESRNIIEKLISEIKKIKVSEFPIIEVPIIQEATDCIDIFRIIMNSRARAIIVENNKGKYFGVITLLDVVSLFSGSSSDLHDALSITHIGECIEVRDLVKSYYPLIYDDDDIAEAAQLMTKYETTFLPRARSKDDKTIIGVILLEDIVNKFLELRSKLTLEEG